MALSQMGHYGDALCLGWGGEKGVQGLGSESGVLRSRVCGLAGCHALGLSCVLLLLQTLQGNNNLSSCIADAYTESVS